MDSILNAISQYGFPGAVCAVLLLMVYRLQERVVSVLTENAAQLAANAAALKELSEVIRVHMMRGA